MYSGADPRAMGLPSWQLMRTMGDRAARPSPGTMNLTCVRIGSILGIAMCRIERIRSMSPNTKVSACKLVTNQSINQDFAFLYFSCLP